MQHLQLIRTKSLRPVETPHPSRLHVLHVSAFQLVITQEEVVHVPKVMEQEPATNFHVEEWVDIPIKSRAPWLQRSAAFMRCFADASQLFAVTRWRRSCTSPSSVKNKD